MVKEARWHRGVSAIVNTFAHAGRSFANIVFSLFILLLTAALFANGMLGAAAINPKFARILDSLNAMGLLSFGLFEYGELVNRGLGETHDGIGLGPAAFLGPVLFWLLFFILTILANNISYPRAMGALPKSLIRRCLKANPADRSGSRRSAGYALNAKQSHTRF